MRRKRSATQACSRGRLLSTQDCGRRALRQALTSASPARYHGRPPLRRTSRLTVEAALPRSRAISRIDRPAESPLEISSRSAARSACGARWRARGANPPSRLKTCKTLTARRFKPLAICESVNPAFQALHTARRSALLNLLDMQHLPDRFISKVLLPRVYITPDPFFSGGGSSAARRARRARPASAGARARRPHRAPPSPPGRCCRCRGPRAGRGARRRSRARCSSR